jgi:hypothetical protein
MRAMRFLLLAVAATVVFLTGCGAAENDPNLAAAAEKTEALGSGRFDVNGTLKDNGVTGISCRGSADYDRKRVHVRCEYQGAGVFEAIAIGHDVYLRGDAALGPGTEDKWEKDTEDVGEETALSSLSPQHLLSLLREASSETTRVGEEDVRGDATVKYRLTVDCDAAELNCGGSAPVDVWIAEDRVVRRIAIDDDDGEVTFEFFDFGADVDIEPPPTDQILDPDPGLSGFSSGLGATSCSGMPGAPITEEEAIHVLRRHGFTVSRQGQQLCNAAFDSTMLSNAVSGSLQDVIEREGYLACSVMRLKPGAGAGKKLVGVEGERISAEVDFENVRCTLFAQGPAEAEKVDRLQDAFAELKQTKH